MKLLIFLGLIALVAAQVTNMNKFTASFEYFAPAISGRLTGIMNYDFGVKKILNTYDFASIPLYELFNHDTNVTTGQVRHVWCSSGCDAETLGVPMPVMFFQSGDTLGTTESVRDRNGGVRTCTVYTRNTDQITRLSYDNDGICRVLFSDGRQYRFSPGAKTFTGSWTGIPPSTCPAKTCGIKLDMYQILDESGSIQATDWTKLKAFSADVVSGFRFDQVTGVGMGIVTFSSGSSVTSSARVKISMSFIQSNVRNVVVNLVQLGGGTCIGCGAYVAMLDRSNSGLKRSTATKLGLIVTDGENNQYSNYFNLFPTWRGTGTPVDERNWVYFAIGVGGYIYNQLLFVAGTADKVITRATFADLNTVVSQIISQTCVLSTTSTCPNCAGFCAPVACLGPCLCPDCNDYNPCTFESCSNTLIGCVYVANPCSDGDACTFDLCDTTTGCNNPAKTMYYGECRDIGMTDGVDNLCTNDGCRPDSGCFHEYITCFDNNACTNDTCIPASGCYFPPNGGNCEQCEQIPGQPVDCSTIQASRKCEIIACDPTVIVSPSQYPAPALQCKSLGPKVCNDNNPCTIDTCQTGDGSCLFTPVNETIFCTDNNACTRDYCDINLGCQHEAWVCADGNPCTEDLCDPAVLASFDITYQVMKGCNNPPVDCDDKNICTVDTCGSNGCENRLKDCSQDPKLSVLVGTCYTAKCDPSISNDVLVNEGCYLEQIENTTINACGVCCGNELPPDEHAACQAGQSCSKATTTNKSFAVGGLFLAAILIAIIAICLVAGLLGGKKGYDIYLKNKKNLSGAQRSPIYTDEGRTGVNPLYDAQQQQ